MQICQSTQSEERAITLRPSQQYNNLREVAGPNQSESDCVELSGDIGVLDDAASYGRTLRYVACLAARAGCSIESVVLCGSSRAAQASVHAAMKATQWQSYIRGDWKVLHLRDGCPYLPFSGRPIGRPVLINSFESSVEPRVLAVSIAGNLWQVLLVDRKIRYAISLARRRKQITLATADDRCGAPLNSAN